MRPQNQWSLKCIAAFAALALPAVSALHEPPAGKHYIGAWLDYPGAGTDLPVNFNARLGFNASFFHLAMDFPDANEASFPRAALGFVDATLSDAMIYLSVYPRPDPFTVTDDQIDRFARLLAGVASRGRKMFVRFGPEMNGNWLIYGQKADLFKTLWRRTTTAIRKYSNQIAMVWSPNFGDGYPYPGGQYAPTAGSADFTALDTNRDGILSALDDPYSPYYPGDDLVDYVSLSVYWFGPTYPYVNNTLPTAGLFERFLTTPVNFYQLYAVAKNKPMLITESAAAFHERILEGFEAPSGNSTGVTNVCAPFTPGAVPAGPGEVAIKRSFWAQYLTNDTFLTQFNRIVGFGLFEFRKNEECTFRDFGVTLANETLAAFRTDIGAVLSTRYVLANYTGVNLGTQNVTPDTYKNPNGTSGGSSPGSTGTPSPSSGNSGPSIVMSSAILFTSVISAVFVALFAVVA